MVSFKWDWNRAMEVRAEEAAAKASAETADAKIIRIAQLNKLAYN